MNIEKIQILADNLGLEEKVNDLIYAHRRAKGEFALFKKSKAKDKETWEPEEKRLKHLISLSLKALFPEWEGAEWSYGKVHYNACYITIFNPEWKKGE